MTISSDALSGWFRNRQKKSEESTPEQHTDKEEHGAEKTPGKATESNAAIEAGATTGGSLQNEPVVVWEAANRMEAQIVQGRLESEGIPAFIHGEALGPIYGLTTGSLAATRVLVPGPLADKALSILNANLEWEEPQDEEDST